MQNRIAQDIQRRVVGSMAERYMGRITTLNRMGAEKTFSSIVGNTQALPVNPEDVSLQDASGNFYFMADYSALGGPDVLP